MIGDKWTSSCQISSKSVKPLQRYGDLTVFKMAASAILDLLGAYWDHPRRPLDGLHRCAKFGRNRCRSFDNMQLSIFCLFGLKTPIYWGFRGDFIPKMGSNVNDAPKRHIRGVTKKKKKNDTFLAFLASLQNGRDMVVCNSFDIYMFILSRTARWCQYLINSAYLSFFWSCQKLALIYSSLFTGR